MNHGGGAAREMTVGEEPHVQHRSVPLASIWAQTADGLLGSGTEMLWRVPADFAHFKAATMNCPIIMGRSSWDALGRPLPGRTSIVITRNPDLKLDGALVAHSLDEAVRLGQEDARERGSERVWITGGAQIYTQSMPLVDELVVSFLELDEPCIEKIKTSENKVFAPEISPDEWGRDPLRSDEAWRPASGDALRWKVGVFRRL